jgi:hypothetical protein
LNGAFTEALDVEIEIMQHRLYHGDLGQLFANLCMRVKVAVGALALAPWKVKV